MIDAPNFFYVNTRKRKMNFTLLPFQYIFLSLKINLILMLNNFEIYVELLINK